MRPITQSQKVLLTGATGFLGSHLARALLAEKYELIILKRSFSDISRIESIINKTDVYDIDRCPLEQPFKDHNKIDFVIHTATIYGRNQEELAKILEANLSFPLRLLETATFFNTDAFVNTDTTLYEHLNPYALTKKHFADWGKQFASVKRIQVVNIKLEHMYGPKDDNSKFVTYVIEQCLDNVPELKLTAGEQKRDFIYINDVVDAYLYLLRHHKQLTGAYTDLELGTGNAVTIRHLVEQIASLTQTRTLLRFGALPYRENEVMESNADLSKLRDLGWQPKTSLQQGLIETIAYRMEAR